MLMMGLVACAASASPAAAQAFGGAYGGVEIGYGEAEHTMPRLGSTDPGDPPLFVDIGAEAIGYGAFAGIGAQFGPWYVSGEVGLGAGGEDASTDPVNPGIVIEPGWRWSVSGRLGVLIDEASLVYARLGYEERTLDVAFLGESHSVDLGGELIGAGFERLVGDRFSVRGEVVRADLGQEELGLVTAPPQQVTIESSETRLVVGLALQF
jgi:hypothetical protein